MAALQTDFRNSAGEEELKSTEFELLITKFCELINRSEKASFIIQEKLSRLGDYQSKPVKSSINPSEGPEPERDPSYITQLRHILIELQVVVERLERSVDELCEYV